MPNDYYFSSFDPAEGSCKTLISAELPTGIDAPPNSLVAFGGNFVETSGKGSYPITSVTIQDPEHYTSFSISAPANCPVGTYDFTVFLQDLNNPGQKFNLHSENTFTITQGAQDTVIENIQPREISVENLREEIFKIYGTNLSKIDASMGFLLTPENFKLSITDPGDTGNTVLTAKFISLRTPDKGTYQVKGYLENNEPCHSSARLIITE